MPLFQNTMMTDTGNGSSVVKKPAAQTPTPTTATTSAATARRASTPASTATQTVQNNNTPKKTYTPTYSTGSTSQNNPVTPAEAPTDYWGSNYNDYLKMLDKLTNQQYEGEANSASAYKTEANKNLDNTMSQWQKTYNEIEKLLQQQAAANKKRETTMNNAIKNDYNKVISNAKDYYNNLLDTYARSMGYVNQGFEEGKSTSAQARDEAIKLAADLYAMGEDSQNRQTEKDLRSQYISYMNGMKNLNQQLASQGINGGASETAMLGALNGYEANRTDLDEARLAALGQLRQQQMQSNSEAQQAYLGALADLISQRTNQQLGVETNRSSGEYNYANMRNDAENNKANQTLTAQQAYQQWANDLTGKRSDNKTNYAGAVQNVNNERNNAANNYQNMYANALANRSANAQSAARQEAVRTLSEHNTKADSKVRTKNQTKKQEKAAKKRKTTYTAKSSVSGSAKSTNSLTSSKKTSNKKTTSSKSSTKKTTKKK